MALTAALLGWMFDGLEMGLFPLVARPALRDLLGVTDEAVISKWFAVATAGFLVGAATGGVLFGWLGDRIGRVRAMTLSVLTYAVFSGMCGVATDAWQIALLRFVSALGMGGEWSLGVALVMEIWPDRSRAFLAGFIGAAANVGYLLIGLLGLGLSKFLNEMQAALNALGLPESWVTALMANSGWRLLMLFGAMPALLTFLIRLFVPESERWQHEKSRGSTSHWATYDLNAVIVGAVAACGIIYLWAVEQLRWEVRVVGTLLALVIVTIGYMYPVLRYLQRSDANTSRSSSYGFTIRRMLLGAALGGVPLLATWAAIQWAPSWADQLTGGTVPTAKAYTQIVGAAGAIIGTILGAVICDYIGRRLAYTLLCIGSLASALAFFQINSSYGPQFLVMMFVVGALTASFYGWLPLYLPELFPTRFRATGQGFSFNFGRIFAAIGALQTSNLMSLFASSDGQSDYAKACSVMSLIYLVGVVIIWLAPETRGQPLPE
jgi:MFS family permease